MKKSALLLVKLGLLVGGTLVSQSVLADDVKISVNGMVCGFCAQGITKKLNKTESVEDVKVDLENKLVTFKTLKGKDLADKEITEILTGAGYSVVKIERSKP